MKTGSIALALAVTGLIAPIELQADTPLVISSVRFFNVGGWAFLCSGSHSDIGDCEADRTIGRAKLQIKVSPSSYKITISGKCAGEIAPVLADWDLEIISTEMAIDELSRRAKGAVLALPKQCHAKITPEIQHSIEEASAFLVDFAD